MEHTQSSLRRSISERLEKLDGQELEQIDHVVQAMEIAGEGGLHYLGRFLGIHLTENGGFTMELGKQNENTYGVAQGGALYTFADIAIGYKIINEVDSGTQVYTLELKMNFVKPGKGRRLYAFPALLHQGNKTVAAECKITDEENELVAVALGTFFLKKKG